MRLPTLPPYWTVPNPCSTFPSPATSCAPCVVEDLLVMILITPLTAFAPQTEPPGPRMTSILSTFPKGRSNVSQNTPPKRWRIYGPPVHQHQQFVAESGVESARADRPCIGVDPGYIQSGNHSEQIRNIVCARPADGFGRDDEDCGRRPGKDFVSFSRRMSPGIFINSSILRLVRSACFAEAAR